MSVCGDCSKWMKKRECPKEKGFQLGGPSGGTLACAEFQGQMTSDKKPAPREFWVTDPDAYTEHYIHKEEHEAVHCGDFVIHVIEKSAYDQLAAELEKVRQGRDQVRLWNENEQLRAKIEIYEKALDRIELESPVNSECYILANQALSAAKEENK